jgi:hypothetical protein
MASTELDQSILLGECGLELVVSKEVAFVQHLYGILLSCSYVRGTLDLP